MLPVGPEALILVALVAFGASLLGGVAGYGTGLILPPILVPLIGAEAVVPVIGLSSLFTNAGRVLAYRPWLDRGTALRIGLAALPGTVLGAWGFSALGGRGAALVIGSTLVVLVPLRRWARRVDWRLGPTGMAAAGAGYGAVVGGTSGSGVILLTILLATGLSGPAVIATDAAISIGLATVKTLTFAAAGALSPGLILLALAIGGAGFPGGFVAKRLALRMGDGAQTAILDGAVSVGGLLLVWQALR
ncbi:hypothetical protein Rumeso_01714 [Rubellimicrobium mesophilum DSM 19309]|uniref:Probable membrane transporter protein n=1 Tax=Rubellimicrobium mesophilum DSM 19309 TaxID=442562 RepID=A0A017HQU7_9RHOB|nr:sulfite exporter TauE/SafE family protein [Rubellimicrobium mesophilum]EYD76756.1 hypothetical protein Rumeso_01714 [Rubellimicrobium mesophilum DSM 19309]